MDTSSLLIEIFTEELPFSGVKKEINNILPKFKNILKKYNLDSEIELFWTPRRLIITSNNFPIKQPNSTKEFFGPPLEIAYNTNNEPTNATFGFLKKLNISLNQVQTKLKDNKECLYYSYEEVGKESRELLESIISEWLMDLNFGKSMLWGSVEESFIRPIRNIFILLDNKPLKIETLEKKYQFTQSNTIIPHRSNIKDKYNTEIKNLESYFNFLKNNGVIYNQNERKEKILNEIKQIEQANNIKVELDLELLDEIVAITEYPTAMLGEFDKKFLALPKEVIITSMKINQKYFATYNSNGILSNNFIVVCNSIIKSAFSEVIKGNMRVLKARLEDALFFYQNDLLSFNQNETDLELKNIEFIQDSGSIFDKVKREKEIAKIIIQNNSISKESEKIILDSIEISKNDLLSEMVGEFGELQGIMSSYYTNNKALKIPLKEQYLPLGEDTNVPSCIEGAIISISNKLDLILSLFALNKIPSGSKDPFALRRSASGIIKIILLFNINFDFNKILESLKNNYKEIDNKKIENFFYERMEGALRVNQSIINAALRANESDIAKLIANIKALHSITNSEHKNAFKIIFKRVANILSDIDAKEIDTNLLELDEEKNLYKKLQDFKSLNLTSPQNRIDALLDFKDALEMYFDKVMINVSDKTLRENRILLIKSIYEEFFKVGDIKEI